MLHTGDYTAAFPLLQKLLDSSRYCNFMQYFPLRIQVHLSTPLCTLFSTAGSSLIPIQSRSLSKEH